MAEINIYSGNITATLRRYLTYETLIIHSDDTDISLQTQSETIIKVVADIIYQMTEEAKQELIHTLVHEQLTNNDIGKLVDLIFKERRQAQKNQKEWEAQDDAMQNMWQANTI